MLQRQADEASDRALLAKAVRNAGKALGLSVTQIGQVIGKDRTSIGRGVDPGSKSGELALLLIRCYRSLHVLTGGREEDIRHWMQAENVGTGGIPAEQVKSVPGLMRVVEYLDAMRGKT
jgi:hypothetical protein